MYSKKQLADELGISKSSVYRLIKDHHIRYKRKHGQTMLYDDSVLEQLQTLANTKVRKVSDSSDSVTELRNQLREKDAMIYWLQRQLESKEKSLQLTIEDNHRLNQSLQLLQSTATNDDEQAETKKDANSEHKTEKKRHWWQFWL